MAHREDINGYWIYPGTMITREGVYPYRGRQIDSDGSMGLDPNRKYMVYRPRKEITNKKTLESFNGLFLTDEHEMLGKGQRDPGTKPIAGTIYNVRVSKYDPGAVIADLKIQSERVKDLIQGGKRSLSCGYYCDYRPEQGEFNGQHYDFVQFDLIGNHIALVKKGRMGEKCAIFDSSDGSGKAHLTSAMDSADMTDLCLKAFANYGRKESQARRVGKKFACDSAIDINQNEVKFMPTENYDEMLAKALAGKGVNDKAKIDKIIEFINTLDTATEPTKDGDDTTPASTQTEPTQTEPNQTTTEPTQTSTPTPVSKEEFQAAVDAAVAEKYAKEDEGRQLAEDIAPKVGNLWKRGMDADDVAEAACEKLGHKDLPKEARIPFVKAVAAEAKKEPAPKGNGMDSALDAPKTRSSVMSKYLTTTK